MICFKLLICTGVGDWCLGAATDPVRARQLRGRVAYGPGGLASLYIWSTRTEKGLCVSFQLRLKTAAASVQISCSIRLDASSLNKAPFRQPKIAVREFTTAFATSFLCIVSCTSEIRLHLHPSPSRELRTATVSRKLEYWAQDVSS